MAPVLREAPDPVFSTRRTTRAPSCSARSADRSVEASSTTRISKVPGQAASPARISLITGAIASSSLKQGSTIERSTGPSPYRSGIHSPRRFQAHDDVVSGSEEHAVGRWVFERDSVLLALVDQAADLAPKRLVVGGLPVDRAPVAVE